MFRIKFRLMRFLKGGQVSSNCFWSFGMGRKAALAMFVSRRFQGKISRFLFDSAGRIFSALIDFGTCQFHLANVYAPDTVTGCKVFSKIYISIFCPCVALLLVILMV